MEQWIANGVELGWLIDGDTRTVHVYRKNHPVKLHRGIARLAGEGPVEVKLGSIWAGLG